MSVNTTAGAAKWAKTLASIKINAFLIIGTLLVLTTAYFYYSVLNKPAAGALWFVGGAVILYYYYVKWFLGPQPIDPDFMSGNYACPDYLSVIPPGTVDPHTGRQLYTPATKSQYYCVDFVGVSRNGGLKRTTPQTLAEDIKNPAYYFPVDAIHDFGAPTTDTKGNIVTNGRGDFMMRLAQAGLSYNSMGESSNPKGGMHSNGSPSFSGGQAHVNATPGAPGGLMGASASSAAAAGSNNLITPQVIAEAVNYTVANGGIQSMQSATPEQQLKFVDTVIKDEITKGYLPAGTTMAQLQTAGQQLNSGGMTGNSALLAQVMPLLTPASLAAVQQAMKGGMGGGGMGGGPGSSMGGGGSPPPAVAAAIAAAAR